MSDATIIREAVQPLTGSAQDYDSLLALIGDARFVLLGEASHGTHEFYAERAAITKRLIAERGFTVVAIEADWRGRESRAPLRARCEATMPGRWHCSCGGFSAFYLSAPLALRST
jgi:hypothetical protein